MPITDPFSDHAQTLDAPVSGGFDITPDDGTDLPMLTRALMVAGGGDVAIIFKDGGTVTLPSLASGVIYPVRAARILATGTTAMGIVGLV